VSGEVFCQFWLVRREVSFFGWVLGQCENRPVVEVVVGAGFVVCDRLVAVFDNSSVARCLEVLGASSSLGRGMSEGICQRGSVEGADFHVAKCTWKVQPEDIEDSRGEVSDVVKLPTRGSSIQDRSRVMDNQVDPDSTAVGELLVHPPRCISSLCPPGWVVVMGEGATQLG